MTKKKALVNTTFGGLGLAPSKFEQIVLDCIKNNPYQEDVTSLGYSGTGMFYTRYIYKELLGEGYSRGSISGAIYRLKLKEFLLNMKKSKGRGKVWYY
ncbi:hypothetical protein [Weissella koreensis]|uniref:Uncharacterized protein n=1 Tax=Weissella koreensis TaxID=165096 RepID=A0A7H1MLU0_9LACO|nr:hypothetical protein [Weissella koreensis]AVH75222.1 hypothetical protein C4597_03905 [Weissella koreensis]QGN20447.1 hypothetical protein GKC51_03885 [Weissella koreensis]QNT64426.1 hypothetical protein FY536_03610 [Weissella koreensis]